MATWKWRQGDDFVKGNANQNGCPSGGEIILSNAECIKVAQAFQLINGVVDSVASRPRGCYQFRGQIAYFNQHPYGAAHKDAVPLCKKVFGVLSLDDQSPVAHAIRTAVQVPAASTSQDQTYDLLFASYGNNGVWPPAPIGSPALSVPPGDQHASLQVLCPGQNLSNASGASYNAAGATYAYDASSGSDASGDTNITNDINDTNDTVNETTTSTTTTTTTLAYCGVDIPSGATHLMLRRRSAAGQAETIQYGKIVDWTGSKPTARAAHVKFSDEDNRKGLISGMINIKVPVPEPLDVASWRVYYEGQGKTYERLRKGGRPRWIAEAAATGYDVQASVDSGTVIPGGAYRLYVVSANRDGEADVATTETIYDIGSGTEEEELPVETVVIIVVAVLFAAAIFLLVIACRKPIYACIDRCRCCGSKHPGRKGGHRRIKTGHDVHYTIATETEDHQKAYRDGKDRKWKDKMQDKESEKKVIRWQIYTADLVKAFNFVPDIKKLKRQMSGQPTQAPALAPVVAETPPLPPPAQGPSTKQLPETAAVKEEEPAATLGEAVGVTPLPSKDKPEVPEEPEIKPGQEPPDVYALGERVEYWSTTHKIFMPATIYRGQKATQQAIRLTFGGKVIEPFDKDRIRRPFRAGESVEVWEESSWKSAHVGGVPRLGHYLVSLDETGQLREKVESNQVRRCYRNDDQVEVWAAKDGGQWLRAKVISASPPKGTGKLDIFGSQELVVEGSNKKHAKVASREVRSFIEPGPEVIF